MRKTDTEDIQVEGGSVSYWYKNGRHKKKKKIMIRKGLSELLVQKWKA